MSDISSLSELSDSELFGEEKTTVDNDKQHSEVHQRDGGATGKEKEGLGNVVVKTEDEQPKVVCHRALFLLYLTNCDILDGYTASACHKEITGNRSRNNKRSSGGSRRHG